MGGKGEADLMVGDAEGMVRGWGEVGKGGGEGGEGWY